MSDDRATISSQAHVPIQVHTFRNAGGGHIDMHTTIDGSELPKEVSRFLGFGMAMTVPPGVQIPYRFSIVAETIQEAFLVYADQQPLEARKAYDAWVAKQSAANKIIRASPGQNGFRP